MFSLLSNESFVYMRPQVATTVALNRLSLLPLLFCSRWHCYITLFSPNVWGWTWVSISLGKQPGMDKQHWLKRIWELKRLIKLLLFFFNYSLTVFLNLSFVSLISLWERSSEVIRTKRQKMFICSLSSLEPSLTPLNF